MQKSSKEKVNIVTIVACLLAVFGVGLVYIWSVYKAFAIDYYGWEAGSVNIVSSIMLCCFCLGNFFGGFVQDVIGPKKTAVIGSATYGVGLVAASFITPGSSIFLFYLTYCVVAGLGVGFVYSSSLSCMQKWLPKRLGLASGLSSAAFALSTIVFSPVFSSLLSKMTMQKVLLIMGIVLGVVTIGSSLVIRLPKTTASAEDVPTVDKRPAPVMAGADGGSVRLGQAIKTFPFWCLFMFAFFINTTWNVLTPLIKGLGMERGLTEGVAILCVSLTGIFNVGGRLIMSMLSDKIGRVVTMLIIAGITFASALCLIFIQGYGYIIVVGATAFAFGGPAAINPAYTTDLFGPAYSGRNYGVIMLGLGISGIASGLMSNAVYGALGSYNLAFVIGAISAVIAAAALVTVAIIIRRKKNGNSVCN